MFIDSRLLAETTEVRADICIIGAGPAGITIAREFIGTSYEICLLESGGLEFDADTQDLCRGKNIGFPYYDLDVAQLRRFGGASNVWSGVCRPLEEIDFRVREGIPYSGWPFDKFHLDPFYRRAHEVCRLGPYDYELAAWQGDGAEPIPLQGDRVSTAMCRFSPVRFGREYRQEVEQAPNIKAYLFSNVVEIVGGAARGGVTEVRTATLGGKKMSVSARVFVVAAGAIQNARLLLASNGVDRNGIGNEHDAVGRYFMEHMALPGGMLLTGDRQVRSQLYSGLDMGGVHAKGYLTFSPQVLEEEGLLNSRIFVEDSTPAEEARKASNGVLSAGFMWNSLMEGDATDAFSRHLLNVVRDVDDVLIYGYLRSFRPTPGMLTLVNYLEQAPNPDSRVTLSSERDALGMRRVELAWNFGELEKKTLLRANELVGLEAGRAGIGRVKIVESESDTGWPPGVRGAWHQMGTTRMDQDPKVGVVDENCRVHGTENLFIAGSSVFPTSGYTNPTLTIVALALRMADHLKSKTGPI
jgi:choline dehydrogenase-like flavoprotein